MKISKSFTDRISETEYADQLRIISDAGAGVIHVRAHEIVRAIIATRESIIVDNGIYKEWNIINGFREYTSNNIFDATVPGDNNIDIGSALQNVLGTAISPEIVQGDKVHYFLFANPQYWLENNPMVNHSMQQAVYLLPSIKNVKIILVTPDQPLPENLAEIIVSIKFETPGFSELKKYFQGIIENIDSGEEADTSNIIEELSTADIDRICYTAAGMTKDNFETYTSLAIVNSISDDKKATVEDIIKGINEGKTDIVNKNDLLELYPSEDMSNVGGMDNLKEWVAKRSICYSDDAAEFGIEPPKGLVFVGIPGTGKSLAAKAISKVLGIPLVRLDFGRVFNSLLGKSEERIRTALRMVSSMAPCVLFVDEIDKGLGGIGGTGDSGASSRVLGSFLTWLQDNTAPVFTMVTANNIAALPPELLRRGRFDAIFSATLPNIDERLEILKIHLEKRGWSCKENFTDSDLRQVALKAEGYVGAEIESAVKDALIEAYNADEEFSTDHILDALDSMVPLSKSYNEEIQKITLWAKNNATPASKDIKSNDSTSVTKLRRKVKTTRNTIK